MLFLYRWVVSDWSVCSRDCAGGIQKRRVWCENKSNAQVKNKMCKHLEKPERRQACNEQDCPPAWHSGKWNEVSIFFLRIINDGFHYKIIVMCYWS